LHSYGAFPTNSQSQVLSKSSPAPCNDLQNVASQTKNVVAKPDEKRLARRVDLIVIPASQFYYGLVGWTGNKHFNRSLRLYSQRELGLRLTSHELYDPSQRRCIPANSEREVFENLRLVYREPHERNCWCCNMHVFLLKIMVHFLNFSLSSQIRVSVLSKFFDLVDQECSSPFSLPLSRTSNRTEKLMIVQTCS